MGVFFVYILKSAICLVFFFLFNKLFLSKETFHAVNRVVWLLTIAVSLLLPLFEWGGLYTFITPVMISDIPVGLPASLPLDMPLVTIDENLFMIVEFILIAYLLVAALFAVRLILSYSNLNKYISHKRQTVDHTSESLTYLKLLESCKNMMGVQSNIFLLLHDKNISPCSWMNNIIISRRDINEGGREIIMHELAHIKYKHSLDVLIVDLLIVFQWFNPIVWFYKQSLLQTHEYMADKSVLDTGVNTKLYQLLLIKKTADESFGYSMANNFNNSKLKNRIVMMLKVKSSKWALAKCLYLLPLVFGAATLFASPKVSSRFDEISSIAIKINHALADTLKSKVAIVDTEVATSSDSHNAQAVNLIRGKNNPLIMVNGKEYKGAMSAISPDDIVSISVLKDEASVEAYGEKGKHGVVLIILEEGKANIVDTVVTQPLGGQESDSEDIGAADDVVVVGYGSQDDVISARGKKTPLIFVDGKEYKGDLSSISADDVDSMSVLKYKEAFKSYGEKAKNGVVLITLKKKSSK